MAKKQQPDDEQQSIGAEEVGTMPDAESAPESAPKPEPQPLPREYPAVELQVGDTVTIRGQVTRRFGDGVVVEIDPVDLPGSDGYRQSITLHGLQCQKE